MSSVGPEYGLYVAARADRVFFRAMASNGAMPATGPADLGVRVGTDISPGPSGHVAPGQGGMSVAPDDPMNLHRLHRPEELGGSGSKPVWGIARQDLDEPLHCRLDPRKPARHAMIEPAAPMPFSQYQGALEATAPKWGLWRG